MQKVSLKMINGGQELKDSVDQTKAQLADKAPKTKWKNKVGVALGDSITWQDGQPYTQGNVGAIARGYLTLVTEQKQLTAYRNFGQSGKSMSGSTSGDTTVIGKTIDYSDVDFVTIFAGTNDFKLNKVVGPLKKIGSTFDTSQFVGAYQSLIEHILTQKPTIKIFLFTPLQRDNSGYDVDFINTANHRLLDYVEAVKRVGALYALPVLDLYSVSGINKKNFSNYFLDGLHPKDTGYERITEVISPFLEEVNYITNVRLQPQRLTKGLIVYDSFNRADTTQLGTPDLTVDNQPWERITGTYSIAGNVAVSPNTSTNIFTVDSGVSDCIISVTLPTVATNKRLYFRVVDVTNNILLTITAGNVYQMTRVMAGVATILATGATQAANGDSLKLVLSGSSIKFLLNGTQELAVTESNFVTATKHGIGSSASTSGSHDNFAIEI